MMISLKINTLRLLCLGVLLIISISTQGQSQIGISFGKVLTPTIKNEISLNSFKNVSNEIIAKQFFQFEYKKQLYKRNDQLIDNVCFEAGFRNERFDVLLKIVDYDEITNSTEIVPYYNFYLGLSMDKKVFEERKMFAELSLGVKYGLVFYPIIDLKHSYNLYAFHFERFYSDYFGLYANVSTQHFISKNTSIGPFISIPILARFSYTTEVYVKTSDNEEFNYNVTTSGSALSFGLSLRRHFNTKGSSD